MPPFSSSRPPDRHFRFRGHQFSSLPALERLERLLGRQRQRCRNFARSASAGVDLPLRGSRLSRIARLVRHFPAAAAWASIGSAGTTEILHRPFAFGHLARVIGNLLVDFCQQPIGRGGSARRPFTSTYTGLVYSRQPPASAVENARAIRWRRPRRSTLRTRSAGSHAGGNAPCGSLSTHDQLHVCHWQVSLITVTRADSGLPASVTRITSPGPWPSTSSSTSGPLVEAGPAAAATIGKMGRRRYARTSAIPACGTPDNARPTPESESAVERLVPAVQPDAAIVPNCSSTPCVAPCQVGPASCNLPKCMKRIALRAVHAPS